MVDRPTCTDGRQINALIHEIEVARNNIQSEDCFGTQKLWRCGKGAFALGVCLGDKLSGCGQARFQLE